MFQFFDARTQPDSRTTLTFKEANFTILTSSGSAIVKFKKPHTGVPSSRRGAVVNESD